MNEVLADTKLSARVKIDTLTRCADSNVLRAFAIWNAAEALRVAKATSEKTSHIVEVARRYALGDATREELAAAHEAAVEMREVMRPYLSPTMAGAFAALVTATQADVSVAAWGAAWEHMVTYVADQGVPLWSDEGALVEEEAWRIQLEALAEIMGEKRRKGFLRKLFR